MNINQSPQTVREMRSNTRAAQRRNTWIIVTLILLVAVAAVIYFVNRNNTAANQPSVSATDANLINPARPVTGVGIFSTVSGLQFQDLKVGSGSPAAAGDTVSVHYTGWLEDGTKFDSSRDKGTPFEFKLGGGSVIEGWDQGVNGMQVGGVRKLFIPPYLAYGEEGLGDIIPPNATLVFEVELLEIK